MKNIPLNEIKYKIYNARKERQETQIEFGRAMGVSGTAISDWEAGKTPKPRSIEKIQKFFETYEHKAPANIETPVKNDRQAIEDVIAELTAKLAAIDAAEKEAEIKEYTVVITPELRQFVKSKCKDKGVSEYVNTLILEEATK